MVLRCSWWSPHLDGFTLCQTHGPRNVRQELLEETPHGRWLGLHASCLHWAFGAGSDGVGGGSEEQKGGEEGHAPCLSCKLRETMWTLWFVVTIYWYSLNNYWDIIEQREVGEKPPVGIPKDRWWRCWLGTQRSEQLGPANALPGPSQTHWRWENHQGPACCSRNLVL